MEKKIRQYQNTLYIVGTGVIAIGIWSILKSVIFAIFQTDYYDQWLKYGLDLKEDEYAAFYLILAIIVVFDLIIRAYIGLSARAEGKGKKKRSVYLVLAIILAVVSFLTLARYVLETIDMFLPGGLEVYVPGLYTPNVYVSGDQVIDIISPGDMGVPILLELTSFITLCRMLFAGIRIRVLQRALRKKG